MTKEDKLRKEIKKILKLTPTIKNVDDKCGGMEFGVDLIFEREDIFENTIRYGIQIKTKEIRATKNRNSESVKEIIAQLAIAFGHPFPPDEKKLDAVYIITTKEINSYAQEHIQAARVGFREIYFINGQYLDKFLTTGRARINALK